MEKDFKKKINKGLLWNVVNKIVSQVIFVWFGIYLARLLGPEAYGLVGMVTIFSGLARVLVDFGFTSSIIFFQDLKQKDLSTIFWLNLLLSLILYLVFFISAPIVASFYNEPSLSFLTRLISLNFVIYAFSALQNALFTKKIDFRKIIFSSWIAIIFSYSIAFWMAYENFGVLSLVAQILIQSLVSTILIWFWSEWRPSFVFSIATLKPIIKYGVNIAGTNMLAYFTRNTDNLIIGKFLGDSSLGLYTRSYTLMMVPITNITKIFTKVLFPAFSQLQDRKGEFQFYYLSTVHIIALISFPIMFGLSSISSEFVLIFLGNEWSAAIPIIKYLSLLGAFQSILALNGTIYNSTGNANISFKITLLFNIALMISWGIGLWLNGLMGLVYAYLILGSIGSYPILVNALSKIDLSFRKFFESIRYPLIGSTIILMINYIITEVFVDLNIIKLLILKLTVGLIIYCFGIFLFEKKIVSQLTNIIKFQYDKNFKKSS